MSLSFEIDGVLHKIEPTQQITETFKKRNFVIVSSDNPLYKEYPSFELVQDDCSLIDSFKEGDEILVKFNIRGREYQDKNSGEIKYFNTLRAWRISKKEENNKEEKSEEDDLPF